jgi:hypothetical protein
LGVNKKKFSNNKKDLNANKLAKGHYIEKLEGVN